MAHLACRDGMAQLQLELDSLVQQEGSLRKQLDQKEQRLQALDDNLQQLKQSIQDKRAELNSELHHHLSAQERQELEDLTPRLKQMQVRRLVMSLATHSKRPERLSVLSVCLSVRLFVRECMYACHLCLPRRGRNLKSLLLASSRCK